MKKRIMMLTAMLASVAMLFTGCKDEVDPVLSVDENDIVAVAEGDTYEISVESNVKWSASVAEAATHTWVKLENNTGDGNGTIKVIVDENETTNPREAFVEIRMGTETPKRVRVIQDAGEEIIEPFLEIVDAAPINATVSGGDFEITVHSNAAWKAEVDDQEATWVTLIDNEDEGDGVIKVHVDASDAVQQKFTSITIALVDDADVKETIEVSQAANALTFSVDPVGPITIAQGGGTTTINVTSNSIWSVSQKFARSYVTVSKTDGIGNDSFDVTFTNANTGVSIRDVTIVVTAPGGTAEILIKQSGVPATLSFNVAGPLNVSHTAGTQSIGVTSNISSWIPEDNVDWLSVSPSNGAYSRNITLNITANESAEPRTATVTVKKNSNLTDIDVESATLTVVQAGKPAPEMDFADNKASTTIEVASAGETFNLGVLSNISWTLVSNETWMQCNPTIGANNGTVQVSVDANTAYTDRTATLMLQADGNLVPFKMVTIHQAAAVAPVMSFSTTSPVNVGNTAGTTTLSISSNIAWTIGSSETWATLLTTGGTNNGTVTVSYDANDATTARTATITLTAAGSEVLPVTLSIVQAAGDPVVDPNAGITINGVTWATRNLTAAGIFADNINDKGSFFQFGRTTSFPNTGTSKPTGWDGATQGIGDWPAENDPCPEGWRLPTMSELDGLPKTTTYRRKASGVGVWYGNDAAAVAAATVDNPGGCLLFPITGNRSVLGSLSQATRDGVYWSSTGSSDGSAYYFGWTTAMPAINLDNALTNPKNAGRMIRCVKKS